MRMRSRAYPHANLLFQVILCASSPAMPSSVNFVIQWSNTICSIAGSIFFTTRPVAASTFEQARVPSSYLPKNFERARARARARFFGNSVRDF